jgi:hypothetical protein
MFGVFILAGAAEKDKAELPTYHEQVITSMRAVPVYGLESEVPQKLIDELNIRSAGKPL